MDQINLAPNVRTTVEQGVSFIDIDDSYTYNYTVHIVYTLTVNGEEHDVGDALVKLDHAGEVDRIVYNDTNVDETVVENWAQRAVAVYKGRL